jgi:hypothetical protein
MVCETRLRPRQTAAQRAADVRKAAEAFVKGLAAGRIKVKVGPQGAIAFDGITEQERDGVSDACAYRKVMASNNALAKLAIKRAEILAGRGVSSEALAAGFHSHDGGVTFHSGHKK